MDFDIVIIGGGLAGLSAAAAIQNDSNLSVALIERKHVGSNNPSPLTFIDVLKEHNLLDCIKEQYSSFTFHNFSGSSITHILPEESLVVLDYEKACNKIFHSLNRNRNSFDFINNFVTGIKTDSSSILVKLENGNSISAKLLIDASGRSQIVANHFGQHKPVYFSHVYGAFYSGIENLNQKICSFLIPSKRLGTGGGWFYSIESDSASFGYAHITDTPEMNTKSLSSIFQKAQDEFKPYSDYLRKAKINYVEKGVIPISYIRQFVYDNIIIVGDAAGMATNWTCMGTEPALKYGRLAGRLSVQAVSQNNFNILNDFQSTWTEENKTAFDLMVKQGITFWESDHYFWEWIIKNDLAYLSPLQLLNRLRSNEHLINKYQGLLRAVIYKIRSLLNKSVLEPQSITIKS